MNDPVRNDRGPFSSSECELQLRTISDNLADGMVYQIDSGLDGTERRLTYVSRGVEKLHEVPLSEVTQDPSFVYDSVDPDYLPLVIEGEAEALRTMTTFRVDVQVTLPSGRQAWRSFASCPRRLADGRLVWDGVEFDITARKQAEFEYREMQQQLLQTQKMESIGHLAGGIAHDFNNMLSVILGHAEISIGKLELAGNDDAEILSNLHNIRSAAERSADLTRQLLAFARKQTVQPRVLDPNRTVGGMLAMLKRLIGENIDLAWEPSPDAGHILMDPSQVDQILVNLCLNARDAIQGTGRVVISTSVRSLDGEYCARHSGCVPGDWSVLEVSDDGVGMDRATMNRLFEPFFTTKASGRGTGLGLATVYGIVRQNDGFILVESSPGKGSKFSIFLPRQGGTCFHPLRGDSEAAIAGGHETILLVEDEPLIRELMVAMLEPLGYQVMAASCPSEAIDLVRECEGGIDLLVSDMVLPEMNGRDLADRIRSMKPGTKVMFISGYVGDAGLPGGVLAAGTHFLPKPFTLEDLTLRIREAIKG